MGGIFFVVNFKTEISWVTSANWSILKGHDKMLMGDIHYVIMTF
jgi:hypothetical protein